MACIHYLGELDKVETYQTYKPLVLDLSRAGLELVLLLILNGCEIDYAFDLGRGLREKA